MHSDICIAGAGIIGLSLALELRARGLSVVVMDSGSPMQQASTAAAGMLAADDPHNPRELQALSHLSLSLYPSFLARIHDLSGMAVPYQTVCTLQALAQNSAATLSRELRADLLLDKSVTTLSPDVGFTFLSERSVDPRQLAPALLAAVAATPIQMLYNSPVHSTNCIADSVIVKNHSTTVQATHFVDCTGAWVSERTTNASFAIHPVKGQMLALQLPPDLPLRMTLRTEDIYLVPRIVGPAAGRVIVGATVEKVGFDTTVRPHATEALRLRAISLIPGLAEAAVLESWTGLRPATPDGLPVIGPHPTRPKHWLAAGHYRNGILLAPATARVMADLILEQQPATPLESFSPSRCIHETANSVR